MSDGAVIKMDAHEALAKVVGVLTPSGVLAWLADHGVIICRDHPDNRFEFYSGDAVGRHRLSDADRAVLDAADAIDWSRVRLENNSDIYGWDRLRALITAIRARRETQLRDRCDEVLGVGGDFGEPTIVKRREQS